MCYSLLQCRKWFIGSLVGSLFVEIHNLCMGYNVWWAGSYSFHLLVVFCHEFSCLGLVLEIIPYTHTLHPSPQQIMKNANFTLFLILTSPQQNDFTCIHFFRNWRIHSTCKHHKTSLLYFWKDSIPILDCFFQWFWFHYSYHLRLWSNWENWDVLG